jgi:large subunit ribosomal protein L17
MPQPKKGPRFGGTPAHHELILSNLATELIRHGRIRTTLAKAKTVQPLAERMITFGKRGDVHARRQVLRTIRDKDVVHKLFAQVGPAFAERDGGYTRVLKLGPRKGDAAPMALIELVEGVSVDGEGELEEAPRRRWSLRRRRGGTQSVTARERSEERAAAVDRGEELEGDFEPAYESELDAEVEAAQDPAHVPVREDEDEGERPQVDPAEVEARFAAEDEAAGAPAPADTLAE